MLSYGAIEAMRGATGLFEALGERFRPHVDVDGVDLLWNGSGPTLRAVLRRDGARVACPQLEKRFPRAA